VWPARAYYLSSSLEPDNLSKADATLVELISPIEGPDSKVCGPTHPHVSQTRADFQFNDFPDSPIPGGDGRFKKRTNGFDGCNSRFCEKGEAAAQNSRLVSFLLKSSRFAAAVARMTWLKRSLPRLLALRVLIDNAEFTEETVAE
jgi:hypothetical protein